MVVAFVMGCLERGEAVTAVDIDRYVLPFWRAPFECASGGRIRDCGGDLKGKLMTCSRKCVE